MAFIDSSSDREIKLKTWIKDLLTTHLDANKIAPDLERRAIFSKDDVDKVAAARSSRRNTVLLNMLDEKCRAAPLGSEVWNGFAESVTNLQPSLASVPKGDFLDLFIFEMKQWHQSWVGTREIDMSTTRRLELEDFVHPRIMVFARQSFLRDMDISTLLNKKKTIKFQQLFEQGDDLLDPKCVNKVLLRGMQGYGKTTLSTFMAQEYSMNQLWSDQILLVMFCRDLNNITENYSFAELIEKFHGPALRPGLWQYVLEDMFALPHRVILALDGLGTFRGFAEHDLTTRPRITDPFATCSLTDLLLNIINGTMLPKLKVLATSRADGLRDIVMFHRVAELGFFKEHETREFSHKFAGSDQELKHNLEKVLTDKKLFDLTRQPTVCRFFGKRLREQGKTRDHPYMIGDTFTEMMIHLLHHLIRYHHPKVKARTPLNIQTMVQSVSNNLVDIAHLALQILSTFPDKQYITEEEFRAQQIKVKDEVVESGFLTILTTRDFQKVNHFWFISPTYRAFFAAIALVKDINIHPMEEYVDKEEFRDSLLFLAGLLGTRDGTTFLETVIPEVMKTYPAHNVLVRLAETMCAKQGSRNKASRLYLIHLANESQMPDVASIILRHMAGGDKIIKTLPEARNIIDEMALEYFKDQLHEDGTFRFLDEIDADESEDTELKGFDHGPSQPNQDQKDDLIHKLLSDNFSLVLHSLQTLVSKSGNDVPQAQGPSSDELMGKATLLADIFVGQKTEIIQHVHRLHQFLFQRVRECNAKPVNLERLAHEAKESGIILFEAVRKCLTEVPSIDIFRNLIPDGQIKGATEGLTSL